MANGELTVLIIATIMAAIGAFGALAAYRHSKKIERGVAARIETGVEEVLHEVRTMNELTIGQLGEAAETRRILDKPPEERTTRETRHTDASQERSTGA